MQFFTYHSLSHIIGKVALAQNVQLGAAT